MHCLAQAKQASCPLNNYTQSKVFDFVELGQMPQQLRALVGLAHDLRLVPTNHCGKKIKNSLVVTRTCTFPLADLWEPCVPAVSLPAVFSHCPLGRFLPRLTHPSILRAVLAWRHATLAPGILKPPSPGCIKVLIVIYQ